MKVSGIFTLDALLCVVLWLLNIVTPVIDVKLFLVDCLRLCWYYTLWNSVVYKLCMLGQVRKIARTPYSRFCFGRMRVLNCERTDDGRTAFFASTVGKPVALQLWSCGYRGSKGVEFYPKEVKGRTHFTVRSRTYVDMYALFRPCRHFSFRWSRSHLKRQTMGRIDTKPL